MNARTAAIAVLKLIAIAAVYAASAWVSRQLDTVQENVRVFLPQSGVALAFLTLWGARYWPAVAFGSLSITLTSREVVVPLRDALSLAAANSAAAALGAFLLRRLRFDPTFGTMRDLYQFLFIAVLLTPLLNSFAAAMLAWASQWESWRAGLPTLGRRWFGHSISHLIVTPVIYTWSRRWTTTWPRRRRLELLLLVSLLMLLGVHAFTGRSAALNLNYPVSFAPFPFVIWAGLRFGPRGAATSTLLIAAIAIFGTSRGFGPFSGKASGGSLIMLQVYLTAISLSGLFLAAAVAERRTAMEQLRASREQLRALSHRLQETREEERALLSREIHDELGQQLTSLKIGLKALRKRALEEGGPAPDTASRFDRLTELADESVQTIRRIASDLRPGMLDDLGLVASLEWLVRQFEERSGVATNFSTNAGNLPISKDLSIAIFRIVQESLTNVARHANATAVYVCLQKDGTHLVVEIVDNGTGFPKPEEGSAPRKSLGLVGMQERARILDGRLEVVSPPVLSLDNGNGLTGGTMVRATFPLSAREPSKA